MQKFYLTIGLGVIIMALGIAIMFKQPVVTYSGSDLTEDQKRLYIQSMTTTAKISDVNTGRIIIIIGLIILLFGITQHKNFENS